MMRTVLFNQLMMSAAALILTGCSYAHPGPAYSADDGALPAGPDAAPKSATALTTVSTASLPAKPSRTSSATQSQANVVKTSNVTRSSATSSSLPSGLPAPQLASSHDVGQIIPEADTDSDASFDNLEIIDSGLKGKLAILRVGSEPTENNLLSVFAGLKNKTAHRLDLELQTLYKDRAGNQLNSGGSWIPISLKPHEETEYRSSSLSSDAADFLVRIRQARSGGGQ